MNAMATSTHPAEPRPRRAMATSTHPAEPRPRRAMATTTHPAEPGPRRVQLATGPTAPAEARAHVRTAIRNWEVPVDPYVAALLTSELVTNAIRHETGETIMLAISCSRDRLRVDVHDTSRSVPAPVDAPADAEAGRGLTLVATLADEWGFCPTPWGKAVYFTLAFRPDFPWTADATAGVTRGDGEP
jgi:anti-sigma regulatory factor (Ser/Thr protein kinase)